MKIKNDLDIQSPYIVGVGASAGGLDAINTLFENIPENTGLSFVIVQHLSPDHKSMMAELLSRHTLMKVVEAEEGMYVKPNCVYLLPHRKFITVEYGRLRLHEKVNHSVPNNAIDVFFESLAQHYKSNAIGVILSGTGFDGSKGAELIKQYDGIVIAQDPLTAAFDGMPNSVIAKGLADLILPPENIAAELLDYLSELPQLKALHLNSNRDEFTLREILMLVRKSSGLDFSYYKRPTLFRRLAKRLMELNITSIKEYLDYITYHPSEVQVICNEFLINVTQFFRDSEAFTEISEHVIPSIFKGKKSGDAVKVWSIACCSGEETYSLAIQFHEYMVRNNLHDITLRIFGTDIDKNALETASRGVFSRSALHGVPQHLVARYFVQEGDTYRITQEIRKMIVFSYHNIIKDPPFSRMDLVSCRNMLIYIKPESQKDVLRKLHFALNVDGYLFLGSSEYAGSIKTYFEEINKKWRIYKCLTKSRTPESEGIVSALDNKFQPASLTKSKTKNPIHYLSDLFKETLLEDHPYTGIYIDLNFEVKQAVGNFKSYIDLPESGLNLNLLKLVPSDLSIALSVAARKSMKDHETVVMRGVSVRREGHPTRYVNLTVKPYIRQKEYDQQFLFVVLNDGEKKEGAFGSKGVAKTAEEYDRIAELERELKETRDNLQAVIEELEATNEELQSANEEMVSTNEELQSTNEELQSLNEELHTVSAEHQQKIKELMDLNDDMSNYFNTSDFGQILVDCNLLIRKFSPAVARMVNVIESDINRSITDI
ncbi:MAG: chemotaxis protein, partial [Bacteroidetes bacterium]|nr:chemotaxis protein [Bacteroidota bacterium]